MAEHGVFVYTFEDGTTLKLLDNGLSLGEVWTLEEMHGKCEVRYEILA